MYSVLNQVSIDLGQHWLSQWLVSQQYPIGILYVYTISDIGRMNIGIDDDDDYFYGGSGNSFLNSIGLL